MKTLIIGDVFSSCGLDYLKLVYREIVENEQIDFTIVNAENVSHGNGITIRDYNEITELGIDAITMGNHTFGRLDVVNLMRDNINIIRPLNYPKGTEGRGYTVLKCKGKKIGIINLMGRVNLLNLDCPFRAADRAIDDISNDCDLIFVDFHAEATSEKVAMGYYLDGRVSCVYGTHTHVQTADETILPKGTAYITDVGMTGAIHSVLGVEKDIIIDRFLTSMPKKFEHANGRAKLSGIVVTSDDATNRVVEIKRILYKD